MTQPEVAIIIVTFNSAEVIDSCLAAAVNSSGEVIVVDNGSRDGTCALVERHGVRLMANPENRGFAAAVNQGVRATGAPFLLLLNPDAVLESDLGSLVRQCEAPRVGAAGGQLIDERGVPQTGFNVRRFPSPLALIFENLLINRLWPGNPVNWRFRCLGLSLDYTAEVDQPAGAFLMFRRAVWAEMNGFDEGYFPLWFEDVDFCKRIATAGFRIVFEPAAKARHRGAHSIHALTLSSRTESWYRSLLRYSIRHFHPVGRAAACLSVILGVRLRSLLGGSKYQTPEFRRAYRSVTSLAFRCMRTGEVQFGKVLS